jgi:transcriptional regulator GlxA family with amidase domain
MSGSASPGASRTQRRVIISSRRARPDIRDARIRRAIEYLEGSEIPSLSCVASALNLSASRFRHLFKSEVGVSPHQYVHLLRLQRARSLLQSSLLRVKEVAAQIGVNDLSHFVRNYKAVHSETPSQTRARSKQAVTERQ